MGGSIVHDYNSWVYNMWEQNCYERERYGDCTLDFTEYCYEYKQFLHDEYIVQKDEERNRVVK